MPAASSTPVPVAAARSAVGRELDVDAILQGSPSSLPEGHRSGFACFVGRPNVGKSTLLNSIVGDKVSIVTPVPGTTRNVVRGIVTREDFQLVFVDTPGVIKPRTLLNRRLNEAVADAWEGVDVVCLVVDAAAGVGPGDGYLAERLHAVDTPVVCVVNKEDRVSADALIPVLVDAEALGEFTDVVPTSATTGMNVDRLVEVLVGHLPEGPRLFPEAMVTDQPEGQLVGEIIREKFVTRVFEEVPHSIAVVVDDIEQVQEPDAPSTDDAAGGGLVEVYATIFVERDSQKGIVIGRGGRRLKDANTEARIELEQRFGTKVFLDVRVKVAPGWQEDPKHLERFGY